MPISLHNSLTRRVETFTPLDSGRVTMYLCGPTVYNYVHIGNARGPVVFDVLVRLLRRHYPHVVYARNITDVDDKINAAAQQLGVGIETITGRYTQAYREDMAALGIAPPDMEPHATAHIPQIIAMIERLIASGHAYAAEGHVLFDVDSYADYGDLSGRDPDELTRRRSRRSCPLQEESGRFRPMEALDARTARLGQSLGSWPSGLAHRVLGDERSAPGRNHRHPCWRRRPAYSRTTKTRSRNPPARTAAGFSPAIGCTTACLRSTAARCPSRSAT